MEQIDALRKSGLSDHEVRRYMLKHGLTQAQVDDLLPETKPSSTPPPTVDPKRPALSEVASECAEFLERMSRDMVRLNANPVTLAQELLVWSRKLNKAR